MSLKNAFSTLFFTSLIMMKMHAQTLQNWTIEGIDSTITQKVDLSKNVFTTTNSMNALFVKLYKIKHFSKENAVFVHIGDSHIQADLETSVIRNELQNNFGNAGRGLIFPYQVAKSNAPNDVISSSKSIWKSNRVARTDTLTPCGISGFGIESQSKYPELNLELRAFNGVKDSFDKVTLFVGGEISELTLEYNDTLIENSCYEIAPSYAEFNLKAYTSGFKLSFPTTDTIQFFGASLEKKNRSGIIYHSIGANGAKFSDYNKTKRFWTQLKNLNADCYIVSMGTNEAQDPNLKGEDFLQDVSKMVATIHNISPDACIILTTPPVSYFKKIRPNQSLEVITDALLKFCDENNLVCWDLFNTLRGSEGAKIWKDAQLLRGDLVHFSKEGYQLQGKLFVAAFSKAWNDFLMKM